ncbi:mucin-17-like isoform X2 [Chelmon rostratus]|uniref:mucin-17-like isoform X2 n=1 Tax=Chelmon rostratus TaxID=109905 RepID=UPI001BEA23AF|nr:mucin-17-like isoform X2 [Chelmon rostratus]
MSLQVCGCCGWSKVTTYHGLRVHQGRMGCTERGVRVEEHEQQNLWANVGFTNNQKDSFGMDLYASIRIDYYSDMSLRVCHCGWSKMTTYHGLRTHQGKMGCTPKGIRIPEREQLNWKSPREEVDQRKYKPAKRTAVKKETAPSPPITNMRTSSAATTATIKAENKPYFATEQCSRRQQHDFYDDVQVNRPVREHQTPTYPATVVRPKEKQYQALSQPADSRAMTGIWSISSRTDSATRAAKVKEEPKSRVQRTQKIPQRSSQRATKSHVQPQDLSTGLQGNRSSRERPNIPPQVKSLVREGPAATYPAAVVRPKEKHHVVQTLSKNVSPSIGSAAAARIKEAPESPFATPQWPFQKSTNSKASLQLQDLSTGLQVNGSSRGRQTTLPLAAVQPKERNREHQTLSQVNRPVRERQTPTYPATVVRPKEKQYQALSQPADSRAMTGNWSISSRTDSATRAATVKEEPKSPLEIPRRSSQRAAKSRGQPQDLSTGLQVNGAPPLHQTTPPPATAVQPTERNREDQTLSQARQSRVKPEIPPKPQLRGERISEIRQLETVCESVPDSKSTNTRTNSAAAAETTAKEDTKSLGETAQHEFSAGMKVKELARMFSATTTQEAAARPKRKHRQERELSEEMQLAQKLSATTAQERSVQPKEKNKEVQKLSQNVPVSTSATTQMNPASAEAATEEDPTSSSEAAQLSDSSTGLKVKELAQMFSATTTQDTAARPDLSQAKFISGKVSPTTVKETAVHPKEEENDDQNRSQNVPVSTSATTLMNPASAEATTEEAPTSLSEAAQLSDSSTGLKVKELARMFSATTTQETAVQPKGKDREKQRLSQNVPVSTSATTQMNHASAEATTEEVPKSSSEAAQFSDFSMGLKVKELAQMFSAPTTQETAVRPKPKDALYLQMGRK